MALLPRYGLNPVGMFDLLDTALSTLKGGEVMILTSTLAVNSSTEAAAQDVLDGYMYDNTAPKNNRPVATFASSATSYPLYLSDDGLANYGSLFGQVIGTNAGKGVTGTDLGPNSAAASGKVTLWANPGLYSVTVDALATDFQTSIALGGLTPATVLGFSATGKICHAACSTAVAATGMGTFVEFETSGSLVTTPASTFGTAAPASMLFAFNGANMNTRTL